MEDNQRNMKSVWTMVERTQSTTGATKSYWTRVGVGFVNRDASITLKLDCLPINGTLQVREWEPYERRQDTGAGAGDPQARSRPRSQPAANDSLL